jgi:RNA polymerase sigma-70 factor (ECF subfamily)
MKPEIVHSVEPVAPAPAPPLASRDPAVRRDLAESPAVSDSRSTLPDGVASWYREYRATVYRYVRFRVATREAAEDLTSDVFVKALRSHGRYDSSLASPSTRLLRIARNTVLDHFRALRRRGSLHVSLDRAHDLAAKGPSQEERMLQEERVQALLNASGTLRPADQEILSLRYGASLENQEIAETLGITANAVAVRLHRALQRLRDAVETGNDSGASGYRTASAEDIDR